MFILPQSHTTHLIPMFLPDGVARVSIFSYHLMPQRRGFEPPSGQSVSRVAPDWDL